MSLDHTPERPVTADRIAHGTYRGAATSTDLALEDRGVGRVARMLEQKRRQWFLAADETLVLGGTVIAAGPGGIVDLWVFDREKSEMLVDRTAKLPPFVVRISDDPSATSIAAARFIDCRTAIGQRGDRVHVAKHIGESKLTLGFDTTAVEPITAVSTVGESGVRIRQQSACLPVSGWVSAGDREHRMDETAVGMLEYVHGLEGHETNWTWAIGSGRTEDGTPIGFTIREDDQWKSISEDDQPKSISEDESEHEGSNSEDGKKGRENVIWMDGEPRIIGSASVAFDDDDIDCRIETEDGGLSLELFREENRCANTQIGPLAREFNQPLGRWQGTIGGKEIENGYGIAETNRLKW